MRDVGNEPLLVLHQVLERLDDLLLFSISDRLLNRGKAAMKQRAAEQSLPCECGGGRKSEGERKRGGNM